MIGYSDGLNAPILIAAPDEWVIQVREFLEQRGCSVLTASSREDASHILQTQPLRGMIIVSDWAASSEDGRTAGLIEFAKGRIPSVTLVRKTGSYRWIDEVYEPPLHQYCSIPFSLREVLAWMRQAGMLPEQESWDL